MPPIDVVGGHVQLAMTSVCTVSSAIISDTLSDCVKPSSCVAANMILSFYPCTSITGDIGIIVRSSLLVIF